MPSIEEKAAALVAEMADLGAVFAISDNGPTGEPRWTWQPVPELMRNAIRKVWTSAEDRTAPGFQTAMVTAIRKLEAEVTNV